MTDSSLKTQKSHTDLQPANNYRQWYAFGFVFVIAFAVLFLTTDRMLNLNDEGITLTAGLRVLAGQVPYRDFYFIYGPALPYIFGALFRIFGPTVFVAFLFDLTLKSLLCASFFVLARRYCDRRIAIFFTALLVLWLFTLQLNLLAVTPVSLFSMWTLCLLLPVFTRVVSLRRFVAVGLLAALTGLFRLDAGIAMLLIVLCMLLAATALYRGSLEGRRYKPIAAALAIVLVFVVVIGSALVIYRAVAPWHNLYFDLFYYPVHYYRVSRRLPLFHRADLEFLGEGTILTPGFTAVLVGIMVIRLWPRQSRAHQLTPETASLIGFLCSFGLLAVMMYVKSLVRIDLWQNYLALVPTLILLAVLAQHRSDYGRVFRGAVYSVGLLCILGSLRFAEHTGRVDFDQKSLLAAHLLRPQAQAPLPPDSNWCELRAPATRYLCFLVDPDHIHAIEFLRSNTQPSDTLYVGLRHHDRAFANDNATYFATGLLPVTPWSEVDPHLQNTSAIQQQIMSELAAHRPPYVVLDSEYEAFNEPNDSSLSTGVTLLDDFIRQQYTPVRNFGELTVLKRK